MALSDYQKKLIEIRTSPIETLAIKYDVKANLNLFDLAPQVDDFKVAKSEYNPNHFVLIFSIKIQEIREKIEYVGTLDDISIRSQIFISWIKSTEGMRQLEEDVLKYF